MDGDSGPALEEKESDVTLDNAACLLFTSGSTGQPKGVVRLHRGIVSRLAWMQFRDDDVFCHNMSFTTGFSQERLFLPLMVGLRLVLVPDSAQRDMRRLAAALEAGGVTHVTLVPATLRQLLSLSPGILARLRLRSVGVGGAVLPQDVADRFFEVFPYAELVNAYGSTESGTVVRGVFNSENRTVCLGQPVSGSTAYILDSSMKPVAPGESGEIFLCGPSVARGYLNDNALTAARFHANPFESTVHGCLYQTGDRGRFLPGGTIEFLGRADRQVKILGYRVELGEVEASLSRHENVLDCIVIGKGDENTRRLIAYVVWHRADLASVSSLRSHVLSQLPEAFCPAVFITLSNIPRTANQKVDISVLPDPPTNRPTLDSAFEPPQNEMEHALVSFWQSLLNIGSLGVGDNFFELGGDSLLAAQLFSYVSATFNTEISGEEFLVAPTVRSLAETISRKGSQAQTRFEETQPQGQRHRAGLSIGQELNLVEALGGALRGEPSVPRSTAFGFMFEGPLDPHLLEKAIAAVVQRHEGLRTAFVPVAIAGSLSWRGWSTIKSVAGIRSMKARIHFECEIAEAPDTPMALVDLCGKATDTQETAIRQIVSDLLETPYDYSRPPFLRPILVTTGPREHRLFLGVSHLVFDGFSRAVFQREVAAFYNALRVGETPNLPQVPVQFGDYAVWQRQRLKGQKLDELTRYWRLQYEEFPRLTVYDLPFATQNPDRHDRRGNLQKLVLDPEATQGLRRLGARNAVSLFVVLVTAVSILLSVLTRRQQITLGTYFANRDHPATQSLIGDFATSHMLGLDLSSDPDIGELFRRTRQTVTYAATHQEIPPLLLGRLLANSPGWASLIQGPIVMFEWRPRVESVFSSGISTDRIELLPYLSQMGGQPFRVLATESRAGEIALGIAYHVRVFSTEAIRHYLRNIDSTIRLMVAAPGTRLSSFSEQLGSGAMTQHR